MAYLAAIGTRKGLFLATSDDRRSWSVEGPINVDPDGFTDASEFYSIGIDPRTNRIMVGASSPHFGTSLWSSDDLGRTWREPQQAPIAFPQDLPYRPLDFSDNPGVDQPDSDKKNTLARVWQLVFGDQPGRVYAGVEPSALFISDDGGETFEFNRSLWNVPEHVTWGPGAGGAAVHTIVPGEGDQLTVGVSTGGIYQSDDGGRSWTNVSKGISTDYLPEEYPDSGQCIHKVVRDTSGGYFVQSHGPVFYSNDPESGWKEVSDGLPSRFGFSVVAHPSQEKTAVVFPVEASLHRFPPQNKLQAWRTEDAGQTWSEWSSGLPSEAYCGQVLRDGASVDNGDVPAFYFGTRCGDVYAAIDGQDWVPVAQHLPDVLCVRAVEVS
ncbi:WD40/YVTN/BNR-like repeat-containing protein [Haloglycomyces albus]|uniref:WD40/YVTN/BNR-like repeat-containing protein n=1 Tax=Haloglycomyces albus TaxID=526067 RepID=UPI00046CDAD8|nr:sialidase family protein [Haloglycomyces albus]